MLDGVLPYIKVAATSDADITLSADDSPVVEKFVGDLLITYVVDEGAHLRLVTESERRAAELSVAALREMALANLNAKIAASGVRLAPHANITAVLFDGNLEATLLLWDELIPHLRERHGSELLAAVPARDILAVSSPAHVNELREVIGRIWPDGDHLLTRDVLRHVDGEWRTHRSE